eukprot:Anaeramoba_flamelloidesa334916_60.p1 GENE.a334916_60~~a334916_60.p1  ORF type:complete len:199 (+),score=30.32 a334916_60:69-665(+)
MDQLFLDIRNGDLEAVKFYIDEAPTLDTPNKEGWALLHVSSQCGNFSIVKLLIDKGANVNILLPDNRNALHLAIESENDKIAQLLLSAGVNCEVSDDILQMTPLHLASKIQNTEILALILKSHKEINLNPKMFKDYTPLHISASEGDLKSAKLLLQYKADVNSIGVIFLFFNFLPLHFSKRFSKIHNTKYKTQNTKNK